MSRVMFTIGPFTIHIYGLFLAIAFASGIILAYRRCAAKGFSVDRALDLFIVILGSSVVGARLLFVLVSPQVFLNDPLRIIRIDQGGLVFFGGLIGAIAGSILYLRYHGLPILSTADLLIPSVSLGQAIGRLGCHFNGCCYGIDWHGPFACHVADSVNSAMVYQRFPVQILSSVANLAIFGILLYMDRKQSWNGKILTGYMILYSASRFSLEFLRGDDRGLFVGPFSVSQIISLCIMVAGILLMISKRKQNDERSEVIAQAGS
ncbi:MAG: prolipoprotein diacylglyceryl transferase [Candidatus Wallbacteria bacterium HGW-Wallbacteria-1]|jgi:phosphatidylglycerol:prolipoprotein diacylglycerol transferase|uniref:Phosphatidylglycerol--prolipoprotein diacylglyceryl transferase n=1 Tax=Candidatus Wallbacteria bacterium HGW-Wallbacteria-1 TaxID=2013854 RepID=A0A2N1PT05_9BACT|nr:MAG: prolipoprotein diacylglyceryl transferase [Candidatus Wallbacteria bacterium HGW-Wallbacteria-1]